MACVDPIGSCGPGSPQGALGLESLTPVSCWVRLALRPVHTVCSVRWHDMPDQRTTRPMRNSPEHMSACPAPVSAHLSSSA